MASIIKLDIKTFVNKLCTNFDPNEFELVLVSKDIKSKGKFENVAVMTELVPTQSVYNAKINAGDNEFKMKYLNQLKENILEISSIIISVAKHDKNVVLLCSEVESEFGYLDELVSFIKAKYDIEETSIKKLLKKPKILTKPLDDDTAHNAIKIMEKSLDKLKKKVSKNKKKQNSELVDEAVLLISDMNKKGLVKMFIKFSEIDKDDLKELSKKELTKMAKTFASSGTEKQCLKLVKYLRK